MGAAILLWFLLPLTVLFLPLHIAALLVGLYLPIAAVVQIIYSEVSRYLLGR